MNEITAETITVQQIDELRRRVWRDGDVGLTIICTLARMSLQPRPDMLPGRRDRAKQYLEYICMWLSAEATPDPTDADIAEVMAEPDPYRGLKIETLWAMRRHALRNGQADSTKEIDDEILRRLKN